VAQNSPVAGPCKEGDKLLGLMDCIASSISLRKDFVPWCWLVS
jgi:hypothetical protein